MLAMILLSPQRGNFNYGKVASRTGGRRLEASFREVVALL